MELHWLKYCFFGVCFFLSLPSFARIDLNSKELKQLLKGDLVVRPFPESGKDATVAGISFALIEAPVDRVMEAVSDIDAWVHIFPNTYQSKTVGERNGVRAVRMELGNKLIKMTFYLTVVYSEEENFVRFQLNKDKPHDIPDTRGWIRLIPQPGDRTLVAFTGLAEVPLGVLVNLLGKDVIKWIEHRVLSVPKRLKSWVEGPTGNRYRKATKTTVPPRPQK